MSQLLPKSRAVCKIYCTETYQKLEMSDEILQYGKVLAEKDIRNVFLWNVVVSDRGEILL